MCHMYVLQLTVLDNPFVPKAGDSNDTSDSSTVRLTFRDADSEAIAPGECDMFFKDLSILYTCVTLLALLNVAAPQPGCYHSAIIDD